MTEEQLKLLLQPQSREQAARVLACYRNMQAVSAEAMANFATKASFMDACEKAWNESETSLNAMLKEALK